MDENWMRTGDFPHDLEKNTWVVVGRRPFFDEG